ncbi:ArsR/SmtB family transcription factor [Anaeromyxobacter paludicola]|uniref:Transcriptional regulator n=1 Tax=Anaeromyxobacter paludicola TaxID=2918171 RepID=A0ABN6N695_9BACT|nr:metalloregulator ArsR/SmtB family transcription factor [Anaeromyxobacter paludicola]BDG08704.1 transcriptional regulator [Anaeromyxobacter paludicola]
MSRASQRPAGLARSAPVFAALGDETRLALLSRLCEGGALSTAQLTGGTDISRQAVTKHLDVLAGAGLVHDVRRGRERRWELAPGRLAEARRTMDELSRRWDEALLRLRALVEE